MYCIWLIIAGKQSYALKQLLNWKNKMATHIYLPRVSWIVQTTDLHILWYLFNQMAGLIGYPVNVLPDALDDQLDVPWIWIDLHVVKWYIDVSSGCDNPNVHS